MYRQCKKELLQTYIATKDNLRHMKENILINEGTMQEYDYNEQMNEQDTHYYPKNYKVWPEVSASHRGAYAGLINTDKYMEVTANDTAIYGNF